MWLARRIALARAAAVIGASALAGCSFDFSSPYGAEQKRDPSDAFALPPRADEQTTEQSSASTESASIADAGPTDTHCEAQDVTWSVGGSSCSASAPPLADGASQALTDSTLDDTGTVTAACAGGKLV